MPSQDLVYFFPADPLGPKPDWSQLRARLFSSGIFAETEGGDPMYSLHDLWSSIAKDRGLPPLTGEESVATVEQFIARLTAAGLAPLALGVLTGRTENAELVASAHAAGLIPPDYPVAFSEELKVGPRYATLFDVPCDTSVSEISYTDYGDSSNIFAGRDLLAQPVIPGTDRVVEDGIDLITRWYEDQSTRWTDPETGHSYGLLDLDWENTLGAGSCALEIRWPGYLNVVKLADLLTDLSGLPFRFAFVY